MKPKLAFVDHSFHKKTKSSIFLREILDNNFKIINLWDNSWKGEKNLTTDFINSQDFDYIIFFQVLPSISELKKIRAKLIWVPMYDSVVSNGKSFWKELSTVKIKIISFSRKISKIAKKNNLSSIYLQYFFNPNNFKKVENYGGKRIFFWQRTKFSFNDVKKIIGNQEIKELILKLDVDPGYIAVKPTKKDIKKYNIKIIEGSVSKREYLNLVRRSNIFISPRKLEGIGMSFIEAMSMGLAVVAFNNPTMNEYIIHKKTGYLFSFWDIKEIDWSNFKTVGENARKYCKKGFEEWETNKAQIIKYMKSEYKPVVRLSLFLYFYIKVSRTARSVIRILRFFYKFL